MAARDEGRIGRELGRSRMDADQVAELVDAIDGLGRERPVRVFPKGIPSPDMIH